MVSEVGEGLLRGNGERAREGSKPGRLGTGLEPGSILHLRFR